MVYPSGHPTNDSLSGRPGQREMETYTNTLVSRQGKVEPLKKPVSSGIMEYYRAVDSVLDVTTTLANATDYYTHPTAAATFEAMSPYFWGFLGASIAIAISVVGAAWYVDTFYAAQTPQVQAIFELSAWKWNFLLAQLYFPICSPCTDPCLLFLLSFRGIFITGTSLLAGAVKVPRIRTKNLIRYVFACFCP